VKDISRTVLHGNLTYLRTTTSRSAFTVIYMQRGRIDRIANEA